jgi:hypothetical protein
MIRAWGTENDLRILNVAGPRASEVEGIYAAARTILDCLLLNMTSIENSQYNE